MSDPDTIELLNPTRGPLRVARLILEAMCARYDRIAVVGRPGIGKTTVCDGLGFWASDVLIEMTPAGVTDRWTWARDQVLDRGTRNHAVGWAMEGVTVARALRHGLCPQAVLALVGTPLRQDMPLRADILGDSVDKWIISAREADAPLASITDLCWVAFEVTCP